MLHQHADNDLFSVEKGSFFCPFSRAWCEQFWAEHKYLVMLVSYRLYKEIAADFKRQLQHANATKDRDWTAFADELLTKLAQIKEMPIETGNAKNALSHAFGHLRGKVSTDESIAWHALLVTNWQEAYRQLFILAMKYGDEYICGSRLFTPEAPVSNTWVRVRKKDWFIRKRNGEWEVLSPEDVQSEIGHCKISKLVELRLMAKLGDVTNPLNKYELSIYRG